MQYIASVLRHEGRAGASAWAAALALLQGYLGADSDLCFQYLLKCSNVRNRGHAAEGEGW